MSILRSSRRKDGTWSSSATKISDESVSDPRGSLGLNTLHCPLEPLIELIFVHGLGGGSRKTWSRTTSITDYWPQEWLPKDPAFKTVRIHSFGYDSDWMRGKDNCLNIHHISKSLLGQLSTSPFITDAHTPIIFIGHSLGGLVIKKAYILARQGATYEILSKRFHTIYFLATPHRGSDSAKLLNNVLEVASASRAYIADLVKGSGSLQSINDEFRNYSQEIGLWSFYETQKLKIGPLSKIIVDPDSATLGYREEKQMPMNADHRSICKFETPSDPNYLIIRNALASTVQEISKSVLKLGKRERHSQIEDLREYLGLSGLLEDDLIAAEDARMTGTCKWFTTKESYLKWIDHMREGPKFFWVSGKPAVGKSVLAGHIINQLQKRKTGCSYFFFKYGDKSKSRLHHCLRSLAFQMACTSPQTLDALFEMQKAGVKLQNCDERTLWQSLISGGIFQSMSDYHYWVIDGLDECQNAASFLDPMLAKLDASIPLRILITSRESSEFEKHFLSLGIHRLHRESFSILDTIGDVKRVASVKVKSVLLDSDEDRAAIVNTVLEKSQGSFLWTILVLRELCNAHGQQEMQQVLRGMPRDMGPLYQRILESMTGSSGGRRLTKAILAWTACVIRPLAIKELKGALKMDIEDNFPKLEESISALCGNMVTIDKFSRVQMAHQTAREFLFSNDLNSEFAVKETDGHTRLARACLAYLVGEEMKPPRIIRRDFSKNKIHRRAEFSLYACEAFSTHLAKADPLSKDISTLTEKFLASNVLSWIEAVAQTQNLNPLIQAAKNMKKYVHVCTGRRSPLDGLLQTIKGWSLDLIRIVAKFADALVTCPSAIYFLIPPFCPPESMIHKTARKGRSVSVVGLSDAHWDDRLVCIDCHDGQTSALWHGDELLALGLATGLIVLYNATTFQELKVLHHGEPVRFLQLRNKTALMASCGIRTIKVWDTRGGELLHTFEAAQRFISLAFDENLLIAASSGNFLSSWDLDKNGAPRPDRPWTDCSNDNKKSLRRTACAISVSTNHKMLAVAYSNSPITLWDLEEDTYYGSSGKKLANGKTSTHVVTALLFNPNPNIELLAAAYLDGELVILDPFNDLQVENLRANCHSLAASPDGRLLAGGAGAGTIQVYEFDTLNLLYRINSSNIHIKQLAFSTDGLHLSDIRGSQCNIWEPVDLLQNSIRDETSESTSTSFVDIVTSDIGVKITAIVVHPADSVMICGKDSGLISLYNLNTGAEIRTLYQHQSSVHTLAWWSRRRTIMSFDMSNRIRSWSLSHSPEGGWVAQESLFQSRLDCGTSIIQVLPSETVGKFIISTRESDHLWAVDGHQELVRSYPDKSGLRKWIHHQQSPLHVMCVEGTTASIYAWSDWSHVSSVLLDANMVGLQLKSVNYQVLGSKSGILFEWSELGGSPDTRDLQMVDSGLFGIDNGTASGANPKANDKGKTNSESIISKGTTAIVSRPLLSLQHTTLSLHVAHVLGLTEDFRLLFLDRHSWICSADLEVSGNNNNSSVSYLRHFFIPYDWFAGIRNILCALIKRDVVLVRNNDVAIIKGGLEYAESVDI